MKILKIAFENIHSLAGLQVIDFTKPPLSETGIFAIVGPTGAGKSTILDVILLALYAKMPRIDEKITTEKVEEYGTVLTRGTTSAFAEIEYESKNIKYRSKWTIETRKGKLRDYDMELADLSANVIIESKKSNVPNRNEIIIGLNYEQFLKSIILAQGDFSKFLKAKPEERTEMLEKITGSEIYRAIGKRAFEIAKLKKTELENIKADLNKIDYLTDDKILELKESKSNYEKNIIIIANKLQILTEKLKIKEDLSKLQLLLIENEKKYSIITKEISDYQKYNQKLFTHEKLILIKSDLIEHRDLSKKYNELNTLSVNLHTKISNLKNEIDIKEKRITEIEKELNEFLIKYEKSKPFVVQVREFQKTEHSKMQELNIYTEENNKKIKEINNLNLEKNKIETEIKNLTKNKINIENWLLDNKILDDLNNDYIFIDQNLKEYTILKEKTNKLIDESSFKHIFFSQNWLNFQDIANKQKLLINNNILDLESKILDKTSIETLKFNFEHILFQISVNEKQIEFSKNYNDIFEKKSDIQNKKYIFLKEISEKKIIENKTLNEIEIIKIHIAELKIRLEKEQLEAKYENDRLNLKEESPCPLCGSLEHPYVSISEKSKPDETKILLQKTEKKLSELDKNIKILIYNISELNAKIISTDENILNFEKQQNSLILNFEDNNKKLNQNYQISDIENLKINFDNSLKQKNKLNYDISNIEQLEILKTQDFKINNICEKINDVLELHQKAKDYLQKYKNYYENKSNPNDILIVLKQKYQLYLENIKLIEKYDKELYSSNSIFEEKNQILKQLEISISEFNNKIKNITNEIRQIKENIQTTIKEELMNLSPDNYEEFIKNKIEKLNKELSDEKNIYIKLNTQITEINIQFLQVSTEIKSNKNLLNSKTIFVNEKLKNIEIKSIDEAFAGLLDEQTVESIKQKNQKLNDSKLTVNQSIIDIRKSIESILSQDDNQFSINDLKAEIDKFEKEKEITNQSIGSIFTTLEYNENQLVKRNFLIEKEVLANSEFETWEELNIQIGDAKGKRFAELAQLVTLTELIYLANNHLNRFSNRYLLVKNDQTKGNIDVVDSNMGMSKRSVHTLSGGETFLVSLSLALALSDLASRQTKIESLFIDEGFGTLDENTLDIALVNLEKLHNNSNRTIGLISHVAIIKERITTHIVLEKANNGYSKIIINN